MRIWVDLANSPHVPLFHALASEFRNRGHDIEITAREFAETVPLAKAAGLAVQVIGGHGGRNLSGKAANLVGRARALRNWASGRRFDLAVSHNSYSQIVAARSLLLRTITLMDYEHQPANHLAFRLASRIVVPRALPLATLRHLGGKDSKIRRYHGTKEDVYLADFEPDPHFPERLTELGISGEDVLVVVRPPASEAIYHRFENILFDSLLQRLCGLASVKIILLPRNAAQRESYQLNQRLVLPKTPLNGADLIASSDLVISGGGTMNREAAALGVPAATIYAGKWAAVDQELVREGRLTRLCTTDDLALLPIGKKAVARARRAGHVRSEVADLILES